MSEDFPVGWRYIVGIKQGTHEGAHVLVNPTYDQKGYEQLRSSLELRMRIVAEYHGLTKAVAEELHGIMEPFLPHCDGTLRSVVEQVYKECTGT